MTKMARLLIPCLFIAACQGMPPQTQTQTWTWTEFLDEVGSMDAQQLALARESAVQQNLAQPSDSNRLKAGYVLSRVPASPQQLKESAAILTQIPASSELAPMRDLLMGEISRYMEVQDAESRTLQLRAEVEEVQAQLGVLQEQLAALKKIEAEMVESQEETDEMEP